MSVLLSIAVWIDRINDWIGKFTFFLTLVMVVVGAYNAITRSLSKYIGVNFSSNLYIEVQWYLFSLVFLLGAAYVLKQGEHVRVDILYSRLSRKGKAWVDLFGSCVLLLPVCGLIVFYAIPAV
ncbi:MAG: TRAP transporter small permease subunit, partial [Cyanobacteria bacterium J06635_15]